MIDRGELDQAERGLDSAEFSPLVEQTLRGRLALANAEPKQAVRQLEKALALAPSHGPLRILLGHAQVAAGEYRPAVKTLSAPSVDQGDPPVAALLATAHRELGDLPKAYSVLERAANAHPTTWRFGSNSSSCAPAWDCSRPRAIGRSNSARQS